MYSTPVPLNSFLDHPALARNIITLLVTKLCTTRAGHVSSAGASGWKASQECTLIIIASECHAF